MKKIDDLAPAPPSQADYTKVMTYPVHSLEESKHYRPTPVDYETVAHDVDQLWQEIEDQILFPGLDRKVLSQAIDTRAELLPIEQKLEPFYRRAYDNRREADSEGMGMLLKLNRVVQASGNPALKSRFQRLADWVAAHHGGRHATPPSAPSPTVTRPA